MLGGRCLSHRPGVWGQLILIVFLEQSGPRGHDLGHRVLGCKVGQISAGLLGLAQAVAD